MKTTGKKWTGKKRSGKKWAEYIDKSIRATKSGYRKSEETGERYYEDRPNHSDINPKLRLAKGGIFEHGLEIGDKITGRNGLNKIEGYNKEMRETFTTDLDIGKRTSSKYAKGGGVNSGKVYVLSDFSADSHEDSFEDGILNWVGSWDGKVGMTFSSKEDLIQYINENLIYTDYTEDMFDWETGEGKNIQTDVLCSDVKGYYPADEKEIELWKKGKKKLYNVHYFFYVMAVIPTEYAKGGAMAKGGKPVPTILTDAENEKIKAEIVKRTKEKLKEAKTPEEKEYAYKMAEYMNVYKSDLMAKGGKTKKGKQDPPIVRGYFDDEPYEYGNGGQLSISDRLPVSNQTDAERELELFINNDSGLYRRRKHPIEINLAKKIASGKFDINQAPKIFKYLIDDGIKEYSRLYGKITLTKQEKDNLAKEYVNQFLSDASEGSFDEYIPKKYKMEDGGMLGGFEYSIGGL